MNTGRDHHGAAGAQQLDRAARDGVPVGQPEAVADGRVSGEQGGDVAEIGGALQGPRLRLHGGGLEAGALELLEQLLERDREAGLRGRAAQRAQAPGAARRRPPPPRRGAGPASGRAGAERHRLSPPPGRARRTWSPRRPAPHAPRRARPGSGRRRRRWGRPAPVRGPARRSARAGSGPRDQSSEDRGSGSEAPFPPYAGRRRVLAAKCDSPTPICRLTASLN